MKILQKITLTVSTVFVSSILSAAPLYWDPSATVGASLGGTGNWDANSALWFDGAEDVAWTNVNNDAAYFTGTAGTVTLTENISAGGLYFTNLTGNMVIANATGVETLTLPNGILDTGGTTNTISALLAGSSVLTKNGDGTLMLNGNNTGFTGAVHVNQGTLQTTTTSALGTGTITVTNGGAVAFGAGGTAIANPYVISGGGVNNTGALIATVSQTNTGAFTLETNVVFGANSGTTFDLEGGLTAAGTVNSSVVFGGGGNYRASFGATSKAINLHAGSITLNGGSLNIASTSLTFSNLILNGGQYSSGLSDKAFGTAPNVFNPSNIVLSGGANMLLSHTFTFNGNRGIYLGTGGGLLGANTGGSQITIGGAISGPGSLLIEADGSGASWKVGGNNTFTGLLTVQSGAALWVGGGGNTGTFGKGNTLNNGSITVYRTGTLTYAGAISGSGSLTLGGAGTIILSGTNTYTGNTTATNLYLLVNNTNASGTGMGTLSVGSAANTGSLLGGTGIISGPVAVYPGNTLQPGNATTNIIGTLTINNSLTLQPGSFSSLTIKAATNSAVVGMGSVTFGGTLTVNLLSTPTMSHTYQLFNAASYGGTFESGVVLPSLPTGMGWNTDNLYVNGSISAVRTNGVFNLPVISGTNLVLSGTSGTPNGTYNVLSTTNLALPVASWTVLSTGNAFDNSGNFSFTNPIDPNATQEYFLIQQ
jgi:fibronectin-binding autotransporter adhesin